ncbi:MAG: SpoIIIAH-like family protein [Firmicutes bacterium]|jgi:stage III sporulation protein AH|nr:SpoIIIAH-like family protein [Bacillota bacterium]
MRWRDRSLLVWLLICLLVLLVAAFYLRSQQATPPAEDDKLTDDFNVPQGDESTSPKLDNESGSPEDPVPSGDTDFYVEQRLERDRLRSQEMDTLREIIHSPNSDSANRTEAHTRLLTLSENMAKEAELEGLIKAKNFSDALVYLHGDAVHVLVKVPEITAVEAAWIGDIITTATGLPPEKIIIDTKV